MKYIECIYNYILFLNKKCGLQISLHVLEYENLISASKLLTLSVHTNPYCQYIKSNPKAWEQCLKCQKKTLDKCKSGSFVGTCYAGVKEYIYPIIKLNRVIGFICVSGYKSKNFYSLLDGISNQYCYKYITLCDMYNSLKNEMPDKDKVDVLIEPLCSMLELSYLKNQQNKDDISINDKILNYIRLHHRGKLTVEQISKEFFISRSAISHTFKHNNGISISNYINELRLNDAKHLLETTDLSITEIADLVGFGSVNHFINVFRNNIGLSPQKYRNKT